MTRVLALDVGSTLVRGAVYDERAEPLREHVRRMHGGETDPDALARLVETVAADARGGEPVDAVATSCFWHSLLALDEAGRPLTPILGWRDVDAAEDAERLRAALDADAVHRRTGCVLHTSYWPAKLAWLRRTERATFDRAARFVSFGDYLYGRLDADVRTSLSMASGAGLLRLDTRGWDAELLEVLGLDERRLPPISDEPLAGDVPWFPALGDGACSNLGAGCVTRERATLMIGTSGALRTLYEGGRPEPQRGLFLYRADGRRLVEGGSLSDGGNLYYWLKEVLRLPEGEEPRLRDPSPRELTFLPLLGGERAPGWKLGARGAVAGLTFAAGSQELFDAALAGVAFRFAAIAELLPHVREVVVTGGAMATDDGWVQLVADVLDRPVARARVPEASARGAAVYGLERLGVAAPPPPLERAFEPRRERAEAYRSARERQRRLYEELT